MLPSLKRLSLHLALLLAVIACPHPVFAQQPAPAPDGVLVSQDTLDGYTGRYATVDGLAFRIWREGAVLRLQPEGGAAASLVPDSETTFRVGGMQARVEFVFDASDHISHLLLTQGGATVKAIHR